MRLVSLFTFLRTALSNYAKIGMYYLMQENCKF